MAIRYRQTLHGVGIDISQAGFQNALAEWIDVFGSPPSILRMGSDEKDLAYAKSLLLSYTGKLSKIKIVQDPEFARHEWSLGDSLNQGFGSVGA